MRIPAGLSGLNYTRDATGLVGYDLDLVELILKQQGHWGTVYKLYADQVSAMVGVLDGDCDIAVGGTKLDASHAACPDMSKSGVVLTLPELPSSDYGQAAYSSRWQNVSCLDYGLPYLTAGYALMSYPVPVTTSLSDMVFNVTFLNVITPIFITLFGFAIVFRLLDYRNPNARTLGDTVYYSFVTMATVGYGDIAPLSRVGRSLTVFLMMFGTIALICIGAVVSSKLVIGGLAVSTIDSLSQVSASSLCINKDDPTLNAWIGGQYGITVTGHAVGAPIVRATVDDCIAALRNRTVTAVVADKPVLDWVSAQLYPQAGFYVSGTIFEQYLSWVFPGKSAIRASVLSTLISSFTDSAKISARLAVSSTWFAANPNVATTTSAVAINWQTLIPAIALAGFCLVWVAGERVLDYARVTGSTSLLGRLFEKAVVKEWLRRSMTTRRVPSAAKSAEALNIDMVTEEAKALVEHVTGLSGMMLGKSSTTTDGELARAMRMHGTILRQLATRVVQITNDLKDLRDEEHADVWKQLDEPVDKGEADSHPV